MPESPHCPPLSLSRPWVTCSWKCRLTTGPGSPRRSHEAMVNGLAVRARPCMMKQEKDLAAGNIFLPQWRPYCRQHFLPQWRPYCRLYSPGNMIRRDLEDEALCDSDEEEEVDVEEDKKILMESKMEWTSGCCLGTCHLRHEGKRNFF
jgi:hypothetical protein